MLTGRIPLYVIYYVLNNETLRTCHSNKTINLNGFSYFYETGG